MAAGLLEPSDGSVLIAGEPAGSIDARAATSYLPDNPVLYDDLSLNEHMEYVSRLHEAEDWHDRAAGLLERLGLSHRADDLPARFSRGLRQKASIALGLIRPFSLLLVDEPFVGLDQPGKDALLEMLDEAGDAGATIIVATHQLDYVVRATRCVALRDGDDGRPLHRPCWTHRRRRVHRAGQHDEHARGVGGDGIRLREGHRPAGTQALCRPSRRRGGGRRRAGADVSGADRRGERSGRR